jgi:hypothetical protein
LAHAAWVGAGRSNVPEVFDLNTAFESVSRDKLVPKLEAIGGLRSTGTYTTFQEDCKKWSGPIEVEFRVRKVLLLGPVLYLLHIADLPSSL